MASISLKIYSAGVKNENKCECDDTDTFAGAGWDE